MKRTVILVFIAIFILMLMGLLYIQNKGYEVIKVVEGDLFYIDLNENKIPDDDELFHLKGVNSFPLKFNSKIKIYMEKFDLSEDEVFGLGNLGKKYTEEKLLNKKVKFIEEPDEYKPDYTYRFGKISFNDVDFAKTLLEEGLANAYWGESGVQYLTLENKEKIKENSKKIEKKVEENKPAILKVSVPDTIKVEGINLFLINPNKYDKPNNKCVTSVCKELLSDINNAQESIDLALYGIENQNEILNALSDAKNRGVKIRCVTDTNANGEYTYPDTYKLENICEIKSDKTHHFMHNKFFIFDNKKVLTGSTNISPTGLGGYNSNSVVVIENKEVASSYEKEFEQMFNGNFQNKKEIDNSQKDIQINKDTKIDVYFSPKGNAYQKVFQPLILNAQKSIYINVFYLTHKGIADDLIEAHKRGVEIKIIIDATSAHNPKSKLNELREAGINVKVENWGGKAHEKTMSVDDDYLVLGSMNFSRSGINYNDENLLVINNLDFAKFYNKFFLSLYDSIDNKYLTKVPRAEGFESKNSCYDGIDNDFDGEIDKDDEGCR